MQSNTSTESSSSHRKILYCLDFDGVLCDSVHETFLSGWRACKVIWGNASWLGEFENDPQKMNKLGDDFRFVRPILYVGWESILLIRLLAVGYTEEIAGTPLDVCGATSTRDAVFRGFHRDSSRDFRDHALEAWGVSTNDYKDAMSKARKTWIQEEEGSWIDAHGFYEGACIAVKNYLNTMGNGDVYVITTKAKEFALRLLEKRDLFRSNTDPKKNDTFQEAHVFGLGSGPKASVIQQILETRQGSSGDISAIEYVAVMVEDNIATLDKISKSPVGGKVLPVVASWGYNSVEQLTNVLHVSGDDEIGQSYIVLPLLQESSRLSECDTLLRATKSAERGKQRDPTGCSMASILQSPSDAGNLLSLETNGGDMNDKLYDFSSTGNIALAWFEKQHC